MEYKTVFKCRLCGECYESGCTGSQSVAIYSTVCACLGMPSQAQALITATLFGGGKGGQENGGGNS